MSMASSPVELLHVTDHLASTRAMNIPCCLILSVRTRSIDRRGAFWWNRQFSPLAELGTSSAHLTFISAHHGCGSTHLIFISTHLDNFFRPPSSYSSHPTQPKVLVPQSSAHLTFFSDHPSRRQAPATKVQTTMESFGGGLNFRVV
jgi:hypothetical protein